jgi:hypothetical protein
MAKQTRVRFCLALFVLAVTAVLVPGTSEATCAPAVYDFCWGQGRNVNPATCDCDYNSCLGLPASDCTEQGGWLDTTTCTCRFFPGW